MRIVTKEELVELRLCVFNETTGLCGDWTQRISTAPRSVAVEGSLFCQRHTGLTCDNHGCDKPAVGECPNESGPLVCGYKYCAECGSHKRHYR